MRDSIEASLTAARQSLRLTFTMVSFAIVASMGVAGCGVDYPNCDTDTDCHQGEFCVNKLCQQCRTDQDCGAGQTCQSGACQATPGYCTSASDCGPDQDCQNNMCVSRMQSEVAAPPPPAAAGDCQLEAVYFGYDDATLSDAARNQLSAVATCAQTRGLKSLQLTGLTDPRGTEEYNMALGDRRAQAAKTYLKSLGMQSDLSSSSMGEEIASGTDESTWTRDRRVDVRER